MDNFRSRASLCLPLGSGTSLHDPPQLFNLDSPTLAAHPTLSALIRRQTATSDLDSYFRVLRPSDLTAKDLDGFLSDKLFEPKKAIFRPHRRADTNFLGLPTKRPRGSDGSPPHFTAAESPRTSPQPDRTSELRQKQLASLTAFISKSYQAYRTNFTTNINPVQQPAPVPRHPLTTAPVLPPTEMPTPDESFPGLQAFGEQMSCRFVNYDSQPPRTPPHTPRGQTAPGQVRNRRYFTISVAEHSAKEGKASASTQCSGSAV